MSKRWSLFVERWSNCTLCSYSETRSKVVLARGSLPADIAICGIAPGMCLAGDTLIDTAFRDKSKYPDGIPIKDLAGKSGFQVYSYNLDCEKSSYTYYGKEVKRDCKPLVLGTVKRVWKTGYKHVYKVSFYWWGAPKNGKGGRQKYYGSIKVTSNHPLLLKSGEYRSLDQGLQVGDRLQPFYRRLNDERYNIGTDSSSMQREARFLMEQNLGRDLLEGEETHHKDRNKINDTLENLQILTTSEHARIHGLEDNAMLNPIHRASHRDAMSKEGYKQKISKSSLKFWSNPENRSRMLRKKKEVSGKTSESVKELYKDPIYYYRYLCCRVLRNGKKISRIRIKELFEKKFPNEHYPPSDSNHIVYKIESLNREPVYDMEVEGYHNFVANGIFVHNSEDTLGQPFVGPAGRLLTDIVKFALIRFSPVPSTVFCNIVACLPVDKETGEKDVEPEYDNIMACRPRLEEFLTLAKPKIIVAVGKQSQDNLKQGYNSSVKLPEPKAMIIDIVHPSWILRQNKALQESATTRSKVLIRDGWRKIMEE